MRGTALSRRKLAIGLAMSVLLIPLAQPAAAVQTDVEGVAPVDIARARDAMIAWTEAYRDGDYDSQWRLTHPRIRRWRPRRLWNRIMHRAARTNGALSSYTIIGQAAVTAEQLPCTEQGHCYRPGIQYVLFTLNSDYAEARPPQPEYVAMALLDGEWYFGGGTFLNRPMGETSVILTESDERRYRPDSGNR